MSKVPHKENRFILSIVPLSLIYVGKFYSKFLVSIKNSLLRYFFYSMLLSDILLHGHFILYENKFTEPLELITQLDSNPISVYHNNRLTIPINTLLHQH